MAVDLERELWRAMAATKAPQLMRTFEGIGLSWPMRVQWGWQPVAYYGAERELYEPQSHAPPSFAIVAPVVEHDELIDLAAIELPSEHVGTRLGIGHGLGLDAIEKARCRLCDLHLVERPLDWLRFPLACNVEARLPAEPVYLFDLAELPVTVDGVAQITCSSERLLENARIFFPPSQRDRLVVED